MTDPVPALVCHGCGFVAAEDDPYPFRCPNAGRGDDVDHVLVRTLGEAVRAFPRDEEPNPFVRYRSMFRAYHLARSNGMGDGAYVDLVEALDKEVSNVDGRGFVQTPFAPVEALGETLGVRAWVKDETGNVSGSHKARHLFGLMVHLRVVEELGWVDGPAPDLAIASCGNAALAAAVVARAGGRTLRVFVPTSADPFVIERLGALGARIEVTPRQPGVAGDPTYHALQRAIEGGALPFTCQGNENGLSIEGGHTLGYEMASTLAAGEEDLDRVLIQVGGGALASAVIAGFREANALGVLERLPRFDTVQTRGGFPLERAYRRVIERISVRDADEVRRRFGENGVQAALTYATRHRSEFMWPWETEPHSVAHGILDDETYDWIEVVRGMLASGGRAVVAEEETVERANDLARGSTGIDVDHTGSSGLAGLLALREHGDLREGERVAVLFTGARRDGNESSEGPGGGPKEG